MNILRKDPGLPIDSFYEVRAGCTDVPETKFKIKAGKTLSVKRWQASFSPDGSLDISKCLSRIYRGGIHPSIRGEVWEFLLGCFILKAHLMNENAYEKDEVRHELETMVMLADVSCGVSYILFYFSEGEQYAELKDSCHGMFPVVGSGNFITARVITANGDPIQDPLVGTNPGKVSTPQSQEHVGSSPTTIGPREQDKEIIQWKLALHQIGLDVVRTDRTLMFYEKQENLAKLWDVLAVYAWFDKDVGYGQGMSDLCSPMIMLLEDEADAFWCFERLMRRLRGNFRCTGNTVGVEAQLSNLANVTQVVDPKLHQHLEELGGGGYLFAFRMLMVLFRREFSFGDSLHLWEMMWALEYDPELFSLYEGGGDDVPKVKRKSKRRQYGKYERANMRNKGGRGSEPQQQQQQLPISVFLVASVLEDRSDKLMTEARGLDDVVKILNDSSGNMDAKKACIGAMKLQKKYLKRQNPGHTILGLNLPQLISVYK